MAADDDLLGRVAVIGMAGRFPGARTLDEFWANLRAGVESVRTYTDDELLAAGAHLDDLRDPAYVKAAAPLDDIDQFDAAFFGMSPRDAAVFDPQHRLFLECAWEAFEHAGYVGEQIEGAVGVFASCGLSEYMFKNVLANEQVATSVGEWLIRHTGNDTNFLATRVSYEFDLTGPAMNVQTACSSTLVTVHLACQSLLSGECDMALAGGAVVAPVQHRGYFYKDGEILSPDGHCRAFDANAAGTILSSACGCVLLKPLERAIADGDHVLAVIRGSAINNDGRAKVGYLAPSVSGQAAVIAEALAVSGVEPRDVSYIEAHGTGTLIGDPIEIAGLTQAFRAGTVDTEFCAIGSLKSNIGHTGEAAGVSSLIKTVLALQHAEIPPSLHFRTPNPQAELPSSPFFVNAELRPWKVDGSRPRIAGITGLGAGGTNAHVVLEEAPTVVASGPSRRMQLVTVSARTPAAADRAAADLAAHLRRHPEVSLADVAYTRLAGRKAFASRRAIVAASPAEAATALDAAVAAGPVRANHGEPPSVVFMMPGGGAQYAGMGRELYDAEPVYRDVIDRCARLVADGSGIDLLAAIFPDGDLEEATRRLEQPSIALPALFATEMAMARLLQSWGIEPSAVVGHSAGEYVAACLAGVLTLDDGLALVAMRGRLFDTLPKGAMLSVPMPEAELRELLPAGIGIAAVNAPDLCVASGPVADIDELARTLAGRDVDTVRIHIDVAAHSAMLEPILAEFGAFCRTIRFRPPTIAYVSNLTGTWATAAELTDPEYWVRHLRNTVRFADGMATIFTEPNRFLVEVGPGRTLANLARRGAPAGVGITPTLRHPHEDASDVAFALDAVGKAWCAGVELDPADLFAGEQRRRVPLPTYPFERQRYWVEPDRAGTGTTPVAGGLLRKRHDVGEWFAAPVWRRSAPPATPDASPPESWMLIGDGSPLADALARRLRADGDRVVSVELGARFRRVSGDHYEIDPARASDWAELVEALKADGEQPSRIVHVTAVGRRRGRRRWGLAADPVAAYEATVERDQASLLFLAQALSGQASPVRLAVVTSGAHAVAAGDEPWPERALLHGTCRVIPRELGHVATVAIDVDEPAPGSVAEGALLDRLLRDLRGEWITDVVAYRGGERWVRGFEPLPLPPAAAPPWRDGGVYLITGGLGGIGTSIAEHIASTCRAPRIVLVGRTALPPEASWDDVLADPHADERTAQRIRAVRRLRELGAGVVVAVADVTDAEAMEAIVDQVRRELGPIVGVVHSAGILHDALIALRTPTTTSAVVDIKAKGALVLDAVLGKHPPELLVVCSSVSSIIGLPGQVDYTAANAFLDAWAVQVQRRGRTRAVVVNWSAWQEVGMAVDAARAEVGKAPVVDVEVPPGQLFDAVDDDTDVVVCSTGFSRKRHWLLHEHVVRGGEALIPGTGFVELIRSAATTGHAARPVELRDVFFLSPFAVGVGEVRTLKVKYERATGSVTLFSDAEASPHATATVTLADPEPTRTLDLGAVRARCQRVVERFDGYSDQPFMEFGPRWGNLRSVEYGDGEALVTTVLPDEFAPELDTLWLHPAVLDVATGSAQALVPGFDQAETFFVPLSYGRVVVTRPIPASAVSHVRLRESSARDLAVFDVTIGDGRGEVCVEIEAFTMRRVAPGAALTVSRAAERTVGEPAGLETPIEAALREGILPVEGVDALDRILDAGLTGQVIASSLDVARWSARVDAEARPVDAVAGSAGGAPQYERPNLSVAFTAPATPIERDLAAMWRDLLGVERVGRDDDFFELGGQSLIAVRLFTRLRKTYSIDLPLATLFEAPTIAQCAAIVAARLGVTETPDLGDDRSDRLDAPSAAPPDGLAAPSAAPAGGFRSLVTIQRGGDRTPFFCVHGAGGNVLNFRDLSMAMGRSQPFYGLQARGIDGVTRPHTSIEAMAADYLAEIRAVQPHGPYMLGGYSGGGLVAYEMAQQLTADGEPVSLVLLLDTFPPVIPTERVSLRRRIGRLREQRWDYIRHIVLRRLHWRQYQADLARIADLVARGETVPGELRERHIESSFGAAAAGYALRPWRGHVVLMRAEELAFAFRGLGPAYGWDELVGERFEMIQVPGNHDTLVLEPNASTLVRALRDVLDATQDAAVPAAGD